MLCPKLNQFLEVGKHASHCVSLLLQFAYMMLVGTFPFNSFLAGLLCSLGFFSLTGKHTMSVEALTQQ